MNKFEIFTTEEALIIKNNAIDSLFTYPSQKNKTFKYRNIIKHKDQDLYAGIVGPKLINKCAHMTPEERAVYYDSDKLVEKQYLEDNGWFPPYDILKYFSENNSEII